MNDISNFLNKNGATEIISLLYRICSNDFGRNFQKNDMMNAQKTIEIIKNSLLSPKDLWRYCQMLGIYERHSFLRNTHLMNENFIKFVKHIYDEWESIKLKYLIKKSYQ